MCGIVGAVSSRNVVPIILEGLHRLEYRGYDSAGIAVITKSNTGSNNDDYHLHRLRTTEKVTRLKEMCLSLGHPNDGDRSISLDDTQAELRELFGKIGIAHTRWATHGIANEQNAHPHLAGDRIALVHNGILENFDELKQYCQQQGYPFTSDTDTEVILALLYLRVNQGDELDQALDKVKSVIKGAFSIAAIDKEKPHHAVIYRDGSPLVVGIGFDEYYFASDVHSLLPVTQKYLNLEEGDSAKISANHLLIKNNQGEVVFDSADPTKQQQRPIKSSELTAQALEKGEYRHFMHKEIHEQPQTAMDVLEGHFSESGILVPSFGRQAAEVFSQCQRILMIACGSSYHAAMVFKYWCEDIVRIPVDVEVASEYRYRNPVILDHVLIVCISQSGETADSIAAMNQLLDHRNKHQSNLHILAICNSPESSLVRLADLVFMNRAGIEIGVASTKAFTSQLIALVMLLMAIGKTKQTLSSQVESRILRGLRKLPSLIQDALAKEPIIENLAQTIAKSNTVIFLGRGTMFPVAMEGALKLKEISYIHAEAFPAGELKHGPLALVDENVPVVVLAPNNDLLSKLKSNLEEVSARGGRLFVFQDQTSEISVSDQVSVFDVGGQIGRISAPILMTIPMQLLAYHVAKNLGTDIDQPRNLAKSVTVE